MLKQSNICSNPLSTSLFWEKVGTLQPPFAVVRKPNGQLTAFAEPQWEHILDAGQADRYLDKILQPKAPSSPLPHALGFFGYDFLAAQMGITTSARRDLAVPDGYFFQPGQAFCTVGPARPQQQPRLRKNTAEHFAMRFICNQRLPAYREAFHAAQREIREGNTYQIKLSIRFERPWQLPAITAFQQLLQMNPSPEAFLLVHPQFTLVSCSPEMVIERCGRQLITQPIGGTLPNLQQTDPEVVRAQFARNPKEIAEHNMLVDLERNDLSRVCAAGSVKVDRFRYLETYQHVHHLVSRISGTLRATTTAADIIRAMLPGGTITGCPKQRTIELIDRFEPCSRGPYTGSFGVIENNGDMRFNLIIRTLLVLGQHAFAQAGGGIVIDSTPAYEYRENCLKARSLLDLFR